MSTGQAEALTLRLERAIPASPERVYAAWTQPELMNRWMSPRGLTVTDAEMDLRVGGRWRVVMREPGGATHEAGGTYREVTPPRRLVYTHSWTAAGGGRTPQTVLTVEIEPVGTGSRVVLTQVGFADEASRDGHGVGWGSSLDRLEELFPGGES